MEALVLGVGVELSPPLTRTPIPAPTRSLTLALALALDPSPSPSPSPNLMEALIGAVALDVGGFDEAERTFARIVVPPPEVMAAVATGEVVVPGNSFGFAGKPFDSDTADEGKPGAKGHPPKFIQPFSF